MVREPTDNMLMSCTETGRNDVKLATANALGASTIGTGARSRALVTICFQLCSGRKVLLKMLGCATRGMYLW